MNNELNIFTITDSKMSGIDTKMGKKPKTAQKKVNLLQLIGNEMNNQQVDEILTFEQFKQFVNIYDFEKNEQSMSKPKVQTTLLKPRWSRAQSLVQNKRNQFSVRKSGSISIQVEAHQPNYLQIKKNFLNEIRQQVNTHREASVISQNLNVGLHLTTRLASNGNQNRQSADSSIFRSSAHSSRSHNGLQQINQYQIQKKLGSGAFATVMLCINVKTEQKYAMKIVSNKQLRRKLFSRNSQILADYYINNEIALLKKMQHPNIVKLYQVIEDQTKNKIYLILQYCSGGYINQIKNTLLMTQSKKFDSQYRKLLESQCKRYYRQLCLAVDYIHNVAKISHRDIKPQNILLSDKDQVKLSDFGLGTQDIQVLSKSGTKAYLPPQARNTHAITMSLAANTVSLTTVQPNQRSHLPKVTTQMGDIWAVGMTLVVMLQGKCQQIEDDKIQSFINGLKDISSDCKDFISKCLKINPYDRMTASEMLDHPWIKAKKPTAYNQIQISAEQQQSAIVSINKPS